MSNLESLHACNPSFSICLQTDANYYVDLVGGRGEDVVKKLRRAIALSPNKPTFQLMAGHLGSGKTAELLRLKVELEQQGFVVIYCAADEYLQLDDIGLTELWLVISNLILQRREQKGDFLSLTYLPNVLAEIEQWMRISPPVGVTSYGIRLQKILQALQDSAQHRHQLHYYLEPRLKNPLLEAMEEITEIEVDHLKKLGKKGLVILVDNLDRLSLDQVEAIFGEGGKYLRQFQCHIIYTLPLMTLTHADKQFQQRLKDNVLILLPNLLLRDRQGTINLECLSLLRQVVLTRMLMKISSERRLEHVTDIFDDLETLDLLCLSSHGHLPYLLSILYGCLQWQNLPIQIETLNRVLEMDRATRLSTVGESDRQALQKCFTKPHALTLDAIDLCRRLLLFEHHDAQGYWFSSPFISSK